MGKNKAWYTRHHQYIHSGPFNVNACLTLRANENNMVDTGTILDVTIDLQLDLRTTTVSKEDGATKTIRGLTTKEESCVALATVSSN